LIASYCWLYPHYILYKNDENMGATYPKIAQNCRFVKEWSPARG
jgi:hypothetical protein